MPGKKLLGNAFSLNMLSELPAHVHVEEVERCSFAEAAASARSVVGHPDTAAVLGHELGIEVAVNRETVTLDAGDELLVAQYSGPRLEEGATQLPEGAAFRYLRVTVS